MIKPGSIALLVLAGGAPQLAGAALTNFVDESAWSAAIGGSGRIGFDNLADGTLVQTQYADASFAGFNGGVPVTAAEPSPHSMANVLSVDDPLGGGGGGVSIQFNGARQGAGFWYMDSQFAGNWATVYGPANEVLGSFELIYPHPTEWQFVGFVSSGVDIARIDVAMGPTDRVTLDDVRFSAPVPEPASWLLGLGGGLLLAAWRCRRITAGS
jgi:hypothetical protein